MDTITYNRITKPSYRGMRFVQYVLGIIEGVLALRLFLRLFGANAAAAFTDFVYTLSAPLVQPFISVFRVQQVEGMVFEWTTVLAMVVYWLIAEAIIRLIAIRDQPARTETVIGMRPQDGGVITKHVIR
ncbi:MAG TPA: YggT family protein [Patescibacteria group bacterium]|nr:YggT family protein [Patescibacteria group bacterium]